MIYIETQIPEYEEFDSCLSEYFPKVKYGKEDYNPKFVDMGFSADNKYLLTLDMTRAQFDEMLKKLDTLYYDALEFVWYEEDFGDDVCTKPKLEWLRNLFDYANIVEK